MIRGKNMALSINCCWSDPISLKDGTRKNLIYYIDEIDDIPDKPGIYIFARSHGNSVSPIYIGQADKLKTRIEHQFNNVKLMMGVRNAARAIRILIYCEARISKGQNRKKVLAILENALIDHALSEGHELLNKQGTKKPTHKIEFKGNRTSEKIAPRNMYVKSR
jgi:hypothetical protein